MTGAGVLKRLLANPHLSDRYGNTRVLPLQVRPMLDGVCDLVAYGEEPGTYRLQPDIDGEATMAARLARRLNALGAEAQIDEGLELLTRLGFLQRPDADCIVIPACIPKRAKSGDGTKDKGGRPRAGENAAARKLRLAAEQARGRSQGDLKLPLAGGGGRASPAGEMLADTLRGQLRSCAPSGFEMTGGAETSAGNLPETAQVSLAKPETETCSENLPQQVSVSSRAKEESKQEGGGVKTPSESVESLNPPPSSVAREAANPTKPETGLRGKTETSAAPKPQIEVFAEQLAAKAAAKWQWSEAVAFAAVLVMRGYLLEGYSVAEIEAAVATPSPCNSAAYYGPILARNRRRALKVAERPAAPEQAAAQASASAPVKGRDPRIAEHASWSKLDQTQQITLEWMLEAIDEQDPVKRGRKLRRLEGQYFHLWERFVRRYPEAVEMSRFTELDLPAA